MLRARAFARRAVMASREGMFLYPTLTPRFSGIVSWFSFSSFSDVILLSPASLDATLLPEAGGVDIEDVGDPVRVEGGFTARESAVEATETFEPFVLRAKAANRGRGADVAADDELGVVPLGFMCAAS